MSQGTAETRQQADKGPARQRSKEVLWLRLGGLAAVLLLLIRLVGCRAGAVDQAEKRWQASGVTDYRLRVREVRSTWCYYDVSLEVRGGQVVSGTVTANPGPAADCHAYTGGVTQKAVALSPDQASRWTVPGLFEIARQWEGLAGQENMSVSLEFDPQLGYPTRLHRDNTLAYDDDSGLQVLELERLAP